MRSCPDCHSTLVLEVDPASGTTVCSKCGLVLEESAIVAEVTFGEASSGAAIVQGSYVASGSTGAKIAGPRGRAPQESREQTLANGKRKIYQLANGLALGDAVCETATRLYTLAVTNRFVQGRRTEYVVASCLYVAARMAKTTHMLIDVSDFLHINVFVLGATYLKLVKELQLGGQIPAIDPSLYISRFAQLLEFGDETQRVAQDAVRLVQRFSRDWMHIGRRPAGICGACLLLAARMNNFRRSISEVVQVVKIADVTVRKRLDEFKKTPTSSLSVQEFRSIWLDEAADPPAFVEGQKRERAKLEKGERKDTDMDMNGEDDDLLDQAAEEANREKKQRSKKQAEAPPEETSLFETDVVDPAIMEEINAGLTSADGALVAQEVDELERARLNLNTETSLEGLDEEELDAFLLSPEEVKLKERVWMEMNKDYLQQVADRQRAQEAEDAPVPKRSRKRKQIKAPDGTTTTAPALTAADATKQLLQKKKFSKKLNYKVLESLFDTGDLDRTRGDSTVPPTPRPDNESAYMEEEASPPPKRARREATPEEDIVDVDVDAMALEAAEQARKKREEEPAKDSDDEEERASDEEFDVDEGLD